MQLREWHMSVIKNKEIVTRFFEEMFHQRNIEYIEGRVATDYTNHNASIQVRGPDGLKRAVEAQFKAFPDLHTTLEGIIAEGEKVVVRCTDHFTRQDGVKVSIPWIEIIRLENGKLAEAWAEMDTKFFSDQLIQAMGGE
jgi:predicted SnoaL-like aldol condensation-catalyzing enzyme